MNASVEKALAAWLTAAGITAPVYTGASAEEFDPEALTLIVSVPEVEHSVGPLHRATVNLAVSGPAYHASIEGYRDTANTVRQIVDGHLASGLAAALTDHAAAEFAGLWVRESSERIEEDRWLHTLTLLLGLVR